MIVLLVNTEARTSAHSLSLQQFVESISPHIEKIIIDYIDKQTLILTNFDHDIALTGPSLNKQSFNHRILSFQQGGRSMT